MKAVVDRDIIVNITQEGDTEIGELPKGIGLERLRFDGKKVVDLADLSEIWVEFAGGGFLLHAIPVKNSQKVIMNYRDRKRLVNENNTIRLLNRSEYDQKLADEEMDRTDNLNLKEELMSFIKSLSYAEIDNHIENVFGLLNATQQASLKNLYKVVLYLAKK